MAPASTPLAHAGVLATGHRRDRSGDRITRWRFYSQIHSLAARKRRWAWVRARSIHSPPTAEPRRCLACGGSHLFQRGHHDDPRLVQVQAVHARWLRRGAHRLPHGQAGSHRQDREVSQALNTPPGARCAQTALSSDRAALSLLAASFPRVLSPFPVIPTPSRRTAHRRGFSYSRTPGASPCCRSSHA